MLQRVFVADLVPGAPARTPGSRRATRCGSASSARTRSTCPAGCSSTSATWPSTSSAPGTPSACWRPPTTTPRCRGTSRRRAAPCRCSTTARSRGWPSGRSAARGCGGGSRDGDFDVLHVHEPVVAVAVDARAVGGDRADRRDVPHRQPAVAGHAGGVPDPAAQPGEDLRPDRGLRGRPAHPRRALRRRRRGDPQRGLRRPVRDGARPAAVAGDARAADGRVPRPDRRAAQGAAGAGRGGPGRAGRSGPGRGCSCSAAATATRRCERTRPREQRAAVELLGPLGDADKAALLALGGRLRRAAHRRRELRHRAGRGDERGRAGARERPRTRSGGCWTTARSACCSRSATPAALAAALVALLGRPRRARRGWSRSASKAVRRYDWSRVAAQVLAVYETVRLGADRVGEDAGVAPAARPLAERDRERRRRRWALVAAGVLLVLGWYLSYSAGRLDRLHHRVETSRAALDAQLARRAAAARRGGAAARPGHRPAASPTPPAEALAAGEAGEREWLEAAEPPRRSRTT